MEKKELNKIILKTLRESFKEQSTNDYLFFINSSSGKREIHLASHDTIMSMFNFVGSGINDYEVNESYGELIIEFEPDDFENIPVIDYVKLEKLIMQIEETFDEEEEHPISSWDINTVRRKLIIEFNDFYDLIA